MTVYFNETGLLSTRTTQKNSLNNRFYVTKITFLSDMSMEPGLNPKLSEPFLGSDVTITTNGSRGIVVKQLSATCPVLAQFEVHSYAGLSCI